MYGVRVVWFPLKRKSVMVIACVAFLLLINFINLTVLCGKIPNMAKNGEQGQTVLGIVFVAISSLCVIYLAVN